MTVFYHFCFCILLWFTPNIICQPLEMALQQNGIFKLKQQPKLKLRLKSQGDVGTFKTLVSEQNIKTINKVNSDPNLGYKFQANSFVTLTQKQVKQTYLTLIPSQPVTINFAKTITESKSVPQKTQQQKIISSGKLVTSTGRFQNKNMTSQNQLNGTAEAETIRTLPSPPPISATKLENSVFDIVKEYFNKKQISTATVEKLIIPKYKFKGNLNDIQVVESVPISSKRLLQQLNQKNKPNNSVTSTILDKSKDVDWSCITGKVKAQGNCGACYIFSAIDNAAAVLAIYYLTYFIEFSAQEIIDCSSNSLTYGCQGGFLEGSFAHMAKQGMYTEFTYPYISTEYKIISDSSSLNTNICKQKDSRISRWKIGNFVNIPYGNCQTLKNQLQKHPITVGITGYRMLYLKTGTFTGCRSNDDVDHAVLLIGYKAGVGWKIKNSWGTRWGEGGYAWISQQNSCRICQNAFYSTPPQKYGASDYQANKILKKCPSP